MLTEGWSSAAPAECGGPAGWHSEVPPHYGQPLLTVSVSQTGRSWASVPTMSPCWTQPVHTGVLADRQPRGWHGDRVLSMALRDAVWGVTGRGSHTDTRVLGSDKTQPRPHPHPHLPSQLGGIQKSSHSPEKGAGKVISSLCPKGLFPSQTCLPLAVLSTLQIKGSF